MIPEINYGSPHACSSTHITARTRAQAHTPVFVADVGKVALGPQCLAHKALRGCTADPQLIGPCQVAPRLGFAVPWSSCETEQTTEPFSGSHRNLLDCSLAPRSFDPQDSSLG